MMTRMTTVGAMVGGLGLVLASVVASGGVSVSRADARAANRAAAPWTQHLTAMDRALAAGDVTVALEAWHEAYGAALGSRRWEGFADAGDASLRLGRAAGSPAASTARARDLYLSALFRARDAGSLDGVLRVAEAFSALGDREVARQALRMAGRLPGRGPVEPAQHVSSVDEMTTAPLI